MLFLKQSTFFNEREVKRRFSKALVSQLRQQGSFPKRTTLHRKVVPLLLLEGRVGKNISPPSLSWIKLMNMNDLRVCISHPAKKRRGMRRDRTYEDVFIVVYSFWCCHFFRSVPNMFKRMDIRGSRFFPRLCVQPKGNGQNEIPFQVKLPYRHSDHGTNHLNGSIFFWNETRRIPITVFSCYLQIVELPGFQQRKKTLSLFSLYLSKATFFSLSLFSFFRVFCASLFLPPSHLLHLFLLPPPPPPPFLPFPLCLFSGPLSCVRWEEEEEEEEEAGLFRISGVSRKVGERVKGWMPPTLYTGRWYRLLKIALDWLGLAFSPKLGLNVR